MTVMQRLARDTGVPYTDVLKVRSTLQARNLPHDVAAVTAKIRLKIPGGNLHAET